MSPSPACQGIFRLERAGEGNSLLKNSLTRLIIKKDCTFSHSYDNPSQPGRKPRISQSRTSLSTKKQPKREQKRPLRSKAVVPIPVFEQAFEILPSRSHECLTVHYPWVFGFLSLSGLCNQSETCVGCIVSCTTASKCSLNCCKSTSLRSAALNAARVRAASYLRR